MLRKLGRACRALLLNESGQTMLEYIVIVIFVVIGTIIIYKVIMPIIASVHKTSSAVL